jgi:ABC-type sulfate transport system substrate-binding protein
MPHTHVNSLRRWILALAVGAALPLSASAAEVELLNVSYDVARELYKDVNPAFIDSWAKPSRSSSRMAARASRRAPWPMAWKRRW